MQDFKEKFSTEVKNLKEEVKAASLPQAVVEAAQKGAGHAAAEATGDLKNEMAVLRAELAQTQKDLAEAKAGTATKFKSLDKEVADLRRQTMKKCLVLQGDDVPVCSLFYHIINSPYVYIHFMKNRLHMN